MSENNHVSLPVVAVVLSGGAGTRLWPISREQFPKPFIRLPDQQSLVQKTYLRALQIPGVVEVITVTNAELLSITKQQYTEIVQGDTKHSILLEPCGRNSMASIAVAALYAKCAYPQGCHLLILPGDHLIDNLPAFNAAVMQALSLSQQGKLVTFGIQPDSPKTGYGYIKYSGFEVEQFVEKPQAAVAEQFLASGNYLWNSGMFCLQPASLIRELTLHNNHLLQQCEAVVSASVAANEGGPIVSYRLPTQSFELIESISIDYALMEKSSEVAVVPGFFSWEDLGSWIEFGKCFELDTANNHVNAPVVMDDVTNCVIYGKKRIIAAVGLKELVIVDTDDAVLVAHKDSVQNIKNIVSQLKSQNHPTHKAFGAEQRPWGSFETIHEAPGFKIKTIEVNPCSALSLQSHKHRHEHWVIVQGSAWVTNGDETFCLAAGKSVYIPAGNKHRLENKSDEKLVLVEVQLGHYLGEDDIVRYQDIYGRVAETEPAELVTA